VFKLVDVGEMAGSVRANARSDGAHDVHSHDHAYSNDAVGVAGDSVDAAIAVKDNDVDVLTCVGVLDEKRNDITGTGLSGIAV
jgi:hypothetical protein